MSTTRRGEILVWCVSIAAGVLFFGSLSRLWPLAETDLVVTRHEVKQAAREFLIGRGFDLEGYRSARRLSVDTTALDYVDAAFGRDAAQARIAGGAALVYYRAQFKKRGEVVTYAVRYHPEGGVIGWSKVLPEDHPGARIPVEEARGLAREALVGGLRLDPTDYEERSASTSEQSERRTHTFGFERKLSVEPELIERVSVSVAGDEVVNALRFLRVPAEARREARAAEAPGVALETLGFALVALAAAGGFFIFLRRLRDGTASLGRAAVWPVAVFVALVGTFALESASLFDYWEPLWAQWISNLRYLLFTAIYQIWIVVVLLAVVSAGDSLDRQLGAGRGESLWALGRLRLFDRSVARASARGFLVGLLCGGAMAAAVIVLQLTCGATTSLQPRGFFFYTLNSASPPLTSLLFFFAVALAEELGYRFFGGSWMMALTGRRWLAIAIPALIYGLAHTRLDFLPPAQPFWARALVLTFVGAVWGWAFFRYDALTVVLSHFTADLFIFNWPRLAGGETSVVVISALTIAVPLIPALLYPLFGRRAPSVAAV